MWSLLRTRRWIAFSLLVVTAIVAFGLLSRWQWNRADERRAERIQLAAEASAPPVPLSAIHAASAEWTPVTVTGQFDNARTVLIRQRPLDGSNGFWVATPISTTEGADVWVNRGWIAATGAATQVQQAPDAPSGTVTVSGYLRLAEHTPQPPPADLPSGQAAALDPAALGSATPAFYVEASTTQPSDGAVRPLPLPEIDEGRNVSYAVQWLLFAAVAIAGWFFFLRREAREDAQRQEEPSTSA